MPEIEVSPSIYKRLLEYATSFEDTPNTVVERLLDSVGRLEGEGGRKERAEPGSTLPEGEYLRPILSVLEEEGGSAPASTVIDALEQRLQGRLTPRDFERLDMGELRWRNRARFARLKMVERGLLSGVSPRGIWEITDAGRAYLRRLREVERSA